MTLLIDNYDSFTYNLYQFMSELGAEVVVRRNDEVSAEDCVAMAPDRMVISPGPSTPADAASPRMLCAHSRARPRCWASAWALSRSTKSMGAW